MSKPKQKGAGRTSGTGNVTIDLGETIEKKLRAAGLGGERAGVGKGSQSPAKAQAGAPGLFGGYRPNASSSPGGYRPWYSRFGRPWMGQEGAAPAISPRAFTLIPPAIAQVKTTEVLTGVGLGIIGNRAVVRTTSYFWRSNNSRLLHEGIAFVAGLIPVFVKRNATTLGVAIPGAVFLGGTIVDLLLDLVKMPHPALQGSEGSPQAAGGADAALAARQKLAAIQQRMQQPQAAAPQAQQQQRALPRVVAQPQYA